MEFNFGNVFAEKYKKWACSSKHYKDIICDSPNITEEILKRSACKALKFEQFDEKAFKDNIKLIEVFKDHFNFKDNTCVSVDIPKGDKR